MNSRWGLVLVVVLVAQPVAAEEPRQEADPRDRPHDEIAFLPMFGVSSDTGVALGAFVQVARFKPGARPYASRFQVQGSLSFLNRGDGLELPYHDHYVQLDLPAFPGVKDRLSCNLGYSRLTRQGYYGVGNASVAEPLPGSSGASFYTAYLREQIELQTLLQRKVGSSGFRLHFGLAVARVALTPYEASRLAEDVGAQRAPPGVGRFWQGTAIAGILLDRRDHEVFPTRGFFGDVVLRAAPGGLSEHEYLGATVTGRMYVPLLGKRLVLATRVLGDVLVGDPPLNELGRYGGVMGNSGLGGSNGVRGVPLGRFIGKTKAIGNLELRSLFLPFSVFGEQMVLGAVVFADLGRVWTGAFSRDAARDGSGLGLHAGFGAGPRLRWGDAFVLRTDVALAPGADADGRGTALGFYVTGDASF